MAAAAITASAQIEKGARFGLRASAGMSNLVGFDGNKAALGYGVGLVTEINFSETCYLGTGLGFDNFSHKEEGIEGVINAWNITLPIHLGFRAPLGDASYFFAQAGPQLSYGVVGSDVEFYYGDKINIYDCIERFDVGVGARLGVEFNKLQVSAGVNYGLLKMAEDDGHNLNVNLTLGIMF